MAHPPSTTDFSTALRNGRCVTGASMIPDGGIGEAPPDRVYRLCDLGVEMANNSPCAVRGARQRPTPATCVGIGMSPRHRRSRRKNLMRPEKRPRLGLQRGQHPVRREEPTARPVPPRPILVSRRKDPMRPEKRGCLSERLRTTTTNRMSPNPPRRSRANQKPMHPDNAPMPGAERRRFGMLGVARCWRGVSRSLWIDARAIAQPPALREIREQNLMRRERASVCPRGSVKHRATPTERMSPNPPPPEPRDPEAHAS